MRRFHSYGPVDREEHFCVERRDLVEQCIAQLIGNPDKGGHYFTIWGSRQTGKTWLLRQAMDQIRSRYGDQFVIAEMSMQGIVLKPTDPPEAFLQRTPRLFKQWLGLSIPPLDTWEEWEALFFKESDLFDRPLILLIDEFDKLPSQVIDQMVSLFRDIYLHRGASMLHSLALVGVRAVLGVDSLQGSPFNIQRSLHVQNLTHDEVTSMFQQYQTESGQVVEPGVVNKVFEVTRGQPGLVGWFGELLAEKYNPGKDTAIATDHWNEVYSAACSVEWNNTVLNLIKKARSNYQEVTISLFTQPELPFSIDVEWCSYLYLNGIIDYQQQHDRFGRLIRICRFSSPFVQLRLFNALTGDLLGERLPLLPLDPLDRLDDVFSGVHLDIPALLRRYKDHLATMRAKHINPWKDQPRREDLHLTHAVGHFHLYAWLRDAVGRRCVISPEFPTGNGKIDLLLRSGSKIGLIEVKSFREQYELTEGRKQAAGYAKTLGVDRATVAVFVPVDDDAVLQQLSTTEVIDGVQVDTVAIGWV